MHPIGRSARTGVSRFFLRAAFVVCISVALSFTAACGKKGNPTLKAYDKPEAPAPLRAVHREEKIAFTWDYPSSKENAIADFILLKASGTHFEVRAHIGKNLRTFDETDFEKGREYRYKIVAQNFKGVLSSDSNIISIRPMDVPPPPSGLSFSVEGNSLLLSWVPAEKGLLYNVYRSYKQGAYEMTPVNREPVSENTFRDTFDINKTAYYTVRSLRPDGMKDEGAQSPELKADPLELVPRAPGNVRYQVFQDRVFLSWDDPTETWITQFRIYRRTAGGEYLLLGETQLPFFIDSGAVLTKRDYRINAVGPAKEGPGSEVRGIFYYTQ